MQGRNIHHFIKVTIWHDRPVITCDRSVALSIVNGRNPIVLESSKRMAVPLEATIFDRNVRASGKDLWAIRQHEASTSQVADKSAQIAEIHSTYAVEVGGINTR